MFELKEIKDRYKRKRLRLRIQLGFLQLFHKPVWNMLWLPMAACVWQNRHRKDKRHIEKAWV